jgi:hypothetical protein
MLVLSAAVLALLSACQKGKDAASFAGQEGGTKLVVWSFTDELEGMINNKSGGACVVVSSIGDLFKPFQGARRNPWVVNVKLVVDPAMEQYMETAKLLHDRGYEGRVGQWSEGWFAGMQGVLKDEQGRTVEVFSYFLPTWGLH